MIAPVTHPTDNDGAQLDEHRSPTHRFGHRLPRPRWTTGRHGPGQPGRRRPYPPSRQRRPTAAKLSLGRHWRYRGWLSFAALFFFGRGLRLSAFGPLALSRRRLRPGLGHSFGTGFGRLFSTNFLEVLLQRKATWWTAYQRLVHTVGSFLPTAIALVRLAPHMPFALTNLACARLPLSPAKIWLSSYIGLLPRTLFAVYIGSQLQDWRALLERQRPPWELLLSLGLLALFIYLSRRAARLGDSVGSTQAGSARQ